MSAKWIEEPLADPSSNSTADIWQARAERVKSAISGAWTAYRRFAAGTDDLNPISHSGTRWLYGEATFYDSLDTLWLAGHKEQFRQAVDEIAAGSHEPGSAIQPSHVFEYHIRVVGGLLGAYSVSGDRRLLGAAQKAADQVLHAFDTNTGVPFRSFRMLNWSRYPLQWVIGKVADAIRAHYDPFMRCNSLAGAGSFGPELRVLSRESGDPKYAQAADKILLHIHKYWARDGGARLKTLPRNWYATDAGNPEDPPCPSGKSVLGAGGDSFFEYLFKEQQLRMPKSTPASAARVEMWEWLTKGLLGHGFGHLRRGVRVAGQATHAATVMQTGSLAHLDCYLPGVLALAGHTQASAALVDLGKELLTGCIAMIQSNRLPAEVVRFQLSGSEYKLNAVASAHLLRPEIAESLFVLWRVTGQPRYREIAWSLFEQLEKDCRTDEGGFTGLRDVRCDQTLGCGRDPKFEHSSPRYAANLDDYQPSFFMSETLKYLLLTVSEKELLPLDEWMLTTEGHPLSLSPRCTNDVLYQPACSSAVDDTPWVKWPSSDHMILVLVIGFVFRACLRRTRCVRVRLRVVIAVLVAFAIFNFIVGHFLLRSL